MSKAKGTRCERKARKRLEAEGYSVTRAGGSLGDWDLIAVGPGGVRLIQVKAGKRPYCSPLERESLESFRTPPGSGGWISKELWLWQDYARDPRVEVIP